MIYLLHSSIQKSFLKREVNKIIKSSLPEVNDFNLAKFDAKENSIKEIIDACLEVPMFENKKVVVVDDAYFFTASKSKDKLNTEKDYDTLAKYFKSPIEETDLILLVYVDKLDTRNKFYKILFEKAKIISFLPLKENDWAKYIQQIVTKRNINIESDAIKELARRTLNDRDRLLNELDKLSLYKNSINLNDVLSLVSSPLEEKAYELTNAMLKGDISLCMFIYKDLMTKASNDPVYLLGMLASQFRFLYKINYLALQGKKAKDISAELKENEIRIKLSINNAKKFYKLIPIILDEIYELDYKIKSGQLDRFLGFELFLINFKNKYLI